jgi:hypothetical protein
MKRSLSCAATLAFVGGNEENYKNPLKIICDLADIYFAKCHPDLMLRLSSMLLGLRF